MHEALKVYLKGCLVGWLSHETRGDLYSFRYDARYLEAPREGPLSFSLPLMPEAFDAERTYGFFANLLPPLVVRTKLGASLHLSRNNVFGFLRALGRDCAGAVALYPEGVSPPSDEEERFRGLSDEEALSILQSLRRRPLYAEGESGYRYSGAGAQDKLIARLSGDQVVLPLYGTPSTHIIKPAAPDFEDSVQNEFFCQRLAGAVGLNAANCLILNLRGIPHYVSERYDRTLVAGKPERLHQEDFCQILSVDPERKYEGDGGPTAPQCFSALRRMRAAARDQLSFLDAILFNALIGNADAHAKNYSVVYGKPGRPSFAPLYDLVCTAVYPELSREYAMKIGEDAAFDSVSRTSFVEMATLFHVSRKLVLGRLDDLAERIVPAAATLAETFGKEHPSCIYGKIVAIIKERVAKLAG